MSAPTDPRRKTPEEEEQHRIILEMLTGTDGTGGAQGAAWGAGNQVDQSALQGTNIGNVAGGLIPEQPAAAQEQPGIMADLMSMLGMGSLNQAVQPDNATNPGGVLDTLSQNSPETLTDAFFNVGKSLQQMVGLDPNAEEEDQMLQGILPMPENPFGRYRRSTGGQFSNKPVPRSVTRQAKQYFKDPSDLTNMLDDAGTQNVVSTQNLATNSIDDVIQQTNPLNKMSPTSASPFLNGLKSGASYIIGGGLGGAAVGGGYMVGRELVNLGAKGIDAVNDAIYGTEGRRIDINKTVPEIDQVGRQITDFRSPQGKDVHFGDMMFSNKLNDDYGPNVVVLQSAINNNNPAAVRKYNNYVHQYNYRSLYGKSDFDNLLGEGGVDKQGRKFREARKSFQIARVKELSTMAVLDSVNKELLSMEKKIDWNKLSIAVQDFKFEISGYELVGTSEYSKDPELAAYQRMLTGAAFYIVKALQGSRPSDNDMINTEKAFFAKGGSQTMTAEKVIMLRNLFLMDAQMSTSDEEKEFISVTKLQRQLNGRVRKEGGFIKEGMVYFPKTLNSGQTVILGRPIEDYAEQVQQRTGIEIDYGF